MDMNGPTSTVMPKPTIWWRRHQLHIAIACIALGVLAATSADRLVRQSQAPHFVYLADSFLHGQLDNRVPPPNNNDWIHFEGKTYVSFPPAPAVLMMPFVAVFGLSFNDVVFTLFFGAANVLLMFLVLQMLVREGLSAMGLRDNLWLTALFGFGTVHFACSVLGEVWLTAQVIGLTWTLGYVLFATRARRPLLAGICLALAFDTRVNLAFTVVYFASQLVFPLTIDRRPAGGTWGSALKKALVFAIPVLVVAAAQMWMNQARFNNLFEFGHSFMAGPAGNRIKQNGLFGFHYFEWNLRALLLRLPFVENAPYLYNPDGMSILITTPVFARLFWPRAKPWLYPILWLTVVAGILPPLFYQNSGYVQFGYRFALDVTPYLFMLLAVGRTPMTRVTRALIVFAVLFNLAGAILYKRIGPV